MPSSVDFFISYTRTDERWAEWIAWQLDEAGYTTRLMAWDFRPGQSFVRQMQDGLVSAERVLLVLSPEYLQSEFSAAEWEAGFAERPSGPAPKLLPVRIAPCDPPGLLRPLIYIDLVGVERDEARRRLLDGVKLARVKPLHQPAFPGASKPESAGHLASDYPAGQPGVWSVPFPRNPFFVGRDATLAEIHARFTRPDAATSQRIVVLHGLGGVGKTQLAVEYAHRHRHEYDTVLWITADSPEAVRANLADAAGRSVLGLVPEDVRDEAARLDAVARWLATHDRWLLVADNVNDARAVDAVMRTIPTACSGHVLTTSRVTTWPTTVIDIELPVLAPGVAVTFLLARAERLGNAAESSDAARRIADATGYLPLALEQAVSYVLKHRIAFAEYVERIGRSRGTLLSTSAGHATESPYSLSTTLLLSERHLGLTARAVLRLVAFLAPDEIPRAILHFGQLAVHEACRLLAQMDGTESTFVASSEESIEAALVELSDYSLIRLSPANFSCHRLVQAAQTDRLSIEQKRSWIAIASALLTAAAPEDASDVQAWPAWALLRPHALAVVQHASSAGVESLSVSLMNGLGLYAAGRAVYADAERLFRRVLDIERAVDADMPHAWRTRNNLAELFRVTGRFAEAEPLYQEALALTDASDASSDVRAALVLNNFGLLYAETNRLGDAEQLFRRSVAIFERAGEAQLVEAALPLNNLAELLRPLARYEEAESLYQRALAIETAARGPEHPNVARVLNNLGLLFLATNRSAEAELLFRRAVTVCETHLGPDHPAVATPLGNLAGLLQSKNRFADAEPLRRRVLMIDEGVFGTTHPDVARDLVNLGGFLKLTNRLAEAEPLYLRALAISEMRFGANHPRVAVVLAALADLKASAGLLAAAELLYRRAMAINEQSFGPSHSSVADVAHGLAVLLQALHRPAEAEELFLRAARSYVASLGPHHPSVSVALSSLGDLLRVMGRYGQAEPICRRALEIAETSLGLSHPTTASVINNLALVLLDMYRLAEAEVLFRHALAVVEAGLGPHHPQVAMFLNNLGESLRRAERAADAESFFRRALEIDQASFGDRHPNVGRDLNQVAMAMWTAHGPSAEVADFFERALRVWTSLLGPDHPDVGLALNNLGEVNRQLGHPEKAVPLLQRALAIAETSLGPTHPRVAMALNNLGLALFELGQEQEGIEHLRRAVAIAEANLGPEHAYTRQYQVNLTSMLAAV